MIQTYTLNIYIPFRHLLMAAAFVGGLGLTAKQAVAEEAATAENAGRNLTAPAISLAAKDWEALRAWFRQPQFNISDGLHTYAEDYHRESADTKGIASR